MLINPYFFQFAPFAASFHNFPLASSFVAVITFASAICYCFTLPLFFMKRFRYILLYFNDFKHTIKLFISASTNH
jgi:hypothetical protein